MKYKTHYIIVTGYKNSIEETINEKNEKGYICHGNISSNVTDLGIYYSVLMSKVEEIKPLEIDK